MIVDNNPSVDADEINARVQAIRSRHYRAKVAADLPRPDIAVALSAVAESASRGGLRGFVRSIPVVGALATWAYRRWRVTSAPGLSLRERIRTVPVVGRVVRLAWVLPQVPRFREEASAALDFLRAELDRAAQRSARLEDLLRRQSRALILLERRHEDLAAKVQAGIGAASASASTPAPAPMGDFYLGFEEHFRGGGDTIRERQMPYLERVRRAIAQCAAPRCVDIGCGRGDWLQLLAEHGIAALGLDLDPATVQAAHDVNRDVRLADGIVWLEAQAPGSVDVVTAFQVIEHLPFERFVALVDATFRALSPNGIAIFETPNPENLQVGACNFYYDPTHRQPIPPPVAEFVAKRSGFPEVEILRVNPYPQRQQLGGEGEVVDRLNRLLYGPQDYALIVSMRRG